MPKRTRVKGARKLKRNFERAVEVAAEESRQEIGKKAVRLIQGETRAGNQPKSDAGPMGKFDRLEPSTRQNRRYLARFNRTHGMFRPDRANLTLTGQLVKALTFEINAGRVRLYVEQSQRRGYLTGSGNRLTAPNNQKLAEFLALKGYQFVMLDRDAVEQLTNVARSAMRREIRKNLR